MWILIYCTPKQNKTSDKIRGDDAYLNVLFIIMEIGA
jgi:hypothetical protein